MTQWAEDHDYVNFEYVIGSLDDSALLTKEAQYADIVVNNADSDHLEAVRAITGGVETTNTSHPLFIQTNGTGSLFKFAGGRFANNVIYDDMDKAKIDALSLTNFHRRVDDFFLRYHRAKKSKFDLYLITPPTIFDFGTGPDNIISVQVPLLTKHAIKLKMRPVKVLIFGR